MSDDTDELTRTPTGLLVWFLGEEKTHWLVGATQAYEFEDDMNNKWWTKAGLFPSASTYNNLLVTVSRRERGIVANKEPDHEEAKQLKLMSRTLPENTPHAVRLFYETGGAFHPVEIGKRRVPWQKGAFESCEYAHTLEVPGRVSVVVTSMIGASRKELHRLRRAFQACTWEDKEFIVVESFVHEPCGVLRDWEIIDDCMVIRLQTAKRIPTRLENEIGILMASGQQIAQASFSDMSHSIDVGLSGCKIFRLRERAELMANF